MTYLSDKQRQRGTYIKIISFVLPIIILIIFWNPIRIFLSPAAFAVASNMWEVKEYFIEKGRGIKSFFTLRETFLENIDSLERENDELLSEIALLEEELVVTSAFIGTMLPPKGKILIVHPIFTSLSQIYDSFLISSGFESGVEVGMIVYAAGYKPVGIIDQVGSKSSRVALLTRDGNEVRGIIRETSLTLELTGVGGGDFTAKLPKGITVKKGDLVFWKDNPSMEIGQIAHIENEPQSVSQKIYVKGTYEITSNDRLYIDLP